MFRVIVAGGRDFRDYSLLRDSLDRILSLRLREGVTIVSGMATGADTLGLRYAYERGLAVDKRPADWDKHGRAAGYRRNEEMAGSADALVAFWDGNSRGTGHMINLARARGLAVRVVHY